MRKFLIAVALLVLLPAHALAQTSNVRIVGRASDGTDRPILATTDGKLMVSGTGGGGGGGDTSNIGVTGSTAPGSANLIGGKTGANMTAICAASDGSFCVPQVSSSQITETFTNASANTNTTICPAATNPVSVEIQVQGAGGIGLRNQTLTSATYATGGGAPSVVMTAGSLYTSSVPISTAVTYYGAAGIVICRQFLRQ